MSNVQDRCMPYASMTLLHKISHACKMCWWQSLWVHADWQLVCYLQDRLAGSKVFGEARIRYVQYFARTLLQQAKEMYVLAPHAAIYMVTQVRHKDFTL